MPHLRRSGTKRVSGYPTTRLIHARTRQRQPQPDSRDLMILSSSSSLGLASGMFSAPPDAVSCTHCCHRMRMTSFSFYSTSFPHIQPAQPPSPQPNLWNLPLATLGLVATTDPPQLGPSLLPEPPHSSSCRTRYPLRPWPPLCITYRLSQQVPIFVRRALHTCCLLATSSPISYFP